MSRNNAFLSDIMNEQSNASISSTFNFEPSTFNRFSIGLGKFITSDPYLPSSHPYNYCVNNPLKYIDPSGDSVYWDPEKKEYVIDPGIHVIAYIEWDEDMDLPYDFFYGWGAENQNPPGENGGNREPPIILYNLPPDVESPSSVDPLTYGKGNKILPPQPPPDVTAARLQSAGKTASQITSNIASDIILPPGTQGIQLILQLASEPSNAEGIALTTASSISYTFAGALVIGGFVAGGPFGAGLMGIPALIIAGGGYLTTREAYNYYKSTPPKNP